MINHMTELPSLEAFVAAVRHAVAGPDPQRALRVLLEDVVRRLHGRSQPWLAHVGDEMLLAATSEMTVYHITLSPGIHYPPHDHRMSAMIALYQGTETSFAYRRSGRSLVLEQRHDFTAPSIATLPADAIHSVVNLGAAPSAAIHVYFGDLTRIARSIWDADLNEERPFDNDFYFAQARRMGAGD